MALPWTTIAALFMMSGAAAVARSSVSLRSATSTEDDVDLEQLERDRDSDEGLDALWSSCFGRLEQCWEARLKRWRSGKGCSGESALRHREICSKHMCGSWYKKRCRTGRPQCPEVAHMCAFQDVGELGTRSRKISSGRRVQHARLRVGSHRSSLSHWATDAYPTELSDSSSTGASVNASGTESARLPWTYHPIHEDVMEGVWLEFMHIPLNFGSSIEEAGAKFGVKWGLRHDWTRVPMRDGHYCQAHVVPPNYLPKPNMYTNKEVFTVVRHPYERAISEYRLLLSVPWGDAWKTGLYNYPECSAESLNNWLQNTLQRFLQGDRFINNCHMLPQMEYIQGDVRRFARWELGDVLHAEDLSSRFNSLMESRNHPVRLNISSPPYINAHMDVCPQLSKANLWDVTKEMLNTVYYEDFQGLHYEMH